MKKDITIKERTLNVILGSRYKTNLLLDLIPEWIKGNEDGKMIVFDPQYVVVPAFPGKVSLTFNYEGDFKWVDYLLQQKETIFGKHRTLLILNAADILFPRPAGAPRFQLRPLIPKNFLDLLALSRNLNLDIFFCFQGPNSIPVNLDRYVTSYCILPVLEDYTPSKNIYAHETLKIAIRSMNGYYKKHGKSVKEYLHIRVETKTIYPSLAIDKKKFTKIIKKSKILKKKVEILPWLKSK